LHGAVRRAAITLFSSPHGLASHRVRLVVAEKNLALDVVDVTPPDYPEDLLDLNPYQSLPTLAERELVLYDARVISEYLDERYPQPGLQPSDPVGRAQCRLAVHRIESDWYPLAEQLLSGRDRKEAERTRRILRESLIASVDVFRAREWFLADEFSLADCAVARATAASDSSRRNSKFCCSYLSCAES